MMKRTVFLHRLVPQVKLSEAYKIDTDVSARLYCKEIRVLAYSSSVEANITKPIYILACVHTAEKNAAFCLMLPSWFILFGSQQAKPILNITVSP